MQAIILAAGPGKRLGPLTKQIPKVMLPIRGTPLLFHTITHLKKYNISDIFINLFYRPKTILSQLNDGKKFDVRVAYSREDTKGSYKGPLLLGTAGSLHNFIHVLRGDFFVIYGDVFSKLNLSNMLKFHRMKRSYFTIAIHESSHPYDSDLIELNRNNRITDFYNVPHKKTRGLNNAGIYIINQSVLQFLPSTVPYDFAHDFIPHLLPKIDIYGYKTSDLMFDIGTPDRYNHLINFLDNE